MEYQKKFLLRAAYYSVCASLIYIAILVGVKLFLPFVLGLMIAHLLQPVAGFLAKHSRMGTRISAIASVLLFYGTLCIFAWLIGVLAMAQLDRLAHILPRLYQDTVAPALRSINDGILSKMIKIAPHLEGGAGSILDGIGQGIENTFSTLSEWCLERGTAILRTMPMLLLTAAFTILSSAFICADYQRVVQFLLKQIPKRHHVTILEAQRFVFSILGKLCRAYCLLTGITFVQLLLGLWVLKAENACGIALAISILDLLPVLGSGIVLIPWSVYHLATGNILKGIGFLVLWALIVLVRQILEPKVVGNQLGLHPLATLAAMYCGLKVAGVLGLIFAPVACILVKHLQDQKVLQIFK